MKLRWYQADVDEKIADAWRGGHKYICAVLPTGAGKTVLFSHIIHNHVGACCAIAHRQELVTQISLALARDGVYHGIVGPKEVVKLAVRIHMEELGRSYYRPDSPCKVAGVDTIIRRGDALRNWLQSVTLWVQDECHHVLKDNKWGKAVQMFPNARGLGVTATPLRADGKALGAEADGVFHSLIVGVGMRDLIKEGFLTDYRIFAPPSDLDLKGVKISATTGDFNRHGLSLAVKKSHIIGDIVQHYCRIAPGKLGVTFATDVATATNISDQFNAVGVPSEIVHAGTKAKDRVDIIRKFKRKKIIQLINVDLFGEGFDLPAIECVSMARPTQSYGLYVQQFGRGLRPMAGKSEAIIIDHVGNVMRHGLPDKPRVWSLAREERKRNAKPSLIKVCPNCTAVFDRILKICPYCEYDPPVAERSKPEMVDGDLTELTPETLAKMRGEINHNNMSEADYISWMGARYVPQIAQLRNIKLHRKKLTAQDNLRNLIAYWAGIQRANGLNDSNIYRKFYLLFGVDVFTGQTLNERETINLSHRIMEGF